MVGGIRSLSTPVIAEEIRDFFAQHPIPQGQLTPRAAFRKDDCQCCASGTRKVPESEGEYREQRVPAKMGAMFGQPLEGN